MSASINYSNLTPTLLLDFANTEQLDPRITFTRASIGSYYDTSGILQIAASSRPRFDFNPVTGESLGLLIEESRTNLLLYSDLSNNGFTDGVTVTPNNIVTPSGTLDGVLLTSTVTGGSNTCLVDRTATVLINTTYTFSVYLKAGTSPVSSINLYFTGGTFRQAVGTITWSATPTYVVSGHASATGGIQAVGNGWYRCHVVLNSDNNTGSVSRVYVRDQGTSNVTGHTLYAWGRQTEAGAFATSYIPTVASQVTRAADLASITGTNFSSWFNASQGTFVVTSNSELDRSTSAFRSVLQAIKTSTYNSDSIFVYRNSSGLGAAEIRSASTAVASFATSTAVTRITTTFAYAVNDFSSSSNGATVGTDTSGALPTGIDKLVIGAVGDNNVLGTLNGSIEKIAYYSTRLSNAQLQTTSTTSEGRIRISGVIDREFNIGSGFDAFIFDVGMYSDDKILASGRLSSYNGTARSRIARLNSDGSLDSSFSTGTGFSGIADPGVGPFKIQSDGKIVVGGLFTSYNGVVQNNIVRLNSNGTKDTDFVTGTGFTVDPSITTAQGNVEAMEIQSDGKILVGGTFNLYNGVEQKCITRLNTNGSRDTSFIIGTGFGGDVATQFLGFVFCILQQTDGKILVGGDFISYNGVTQTRITRLNLDGSRDTGFTSGTGFNGSPGIIKQQADGKILVGGNFSSYNGVTQSCITRLNIDGSRDTSFNIGTGFNSTVTSIEVQPNGKILVCGFFTSYNGLIQNRIARLNTDGSLDTSFFAGTGFNGAVFSTATQSTGKIIVGGNFTSYNGIPRNRIIRLVN